MQAAAAHGDAAALGAPHPGPDHPVGPCQHPPPQRAAGYCSDFKTSAGISLLSGLSQPFSKYFSHTFAQGRP